MIIVVDRMPKKESECLFSKYDGDGVHVCTLNKDSIVKNCTLCNSKCDYLVEFKKLKKG